MDRWLIGDDVAHSINGRSASSALGTRPPYRLPAWRHFVPILFITLLSFGALSRSAFAQDLGPFTLEGSLSNGTEGASVPAGQVVRVVGFTSDGATQTWDGTTEADGSYRISGIDRIEGATYAVGTDYSGATYVDRVEPPSGDLAHKELLLFEGSSTDPGIRFEQSAIVLSAPDESRRSLTVLEIHTIVNPTDRAFTPRTDGPGGPAGLLVFPLPPNAAELTPEIGLDPSQVVQIDRGFASFTPILPGRVEIAFRYRLPYGQSSLPITRTARYPIASFQVLSPAEGPQIESAQLAQAENAAAGARQYTRFNGGPFVPGSTVAFTVAGLRVPGGALAQVPPAAVAVGGTFLAVVGVMLGWVRRQRLLAPDEAKLDGEYLVEQIVDLDLAFAEGRMSSEEHQARRAALMRVAARSGAPAATPPEASVREASPIIQPPIRNIEGSEGRGARI